MTSDNSHDSEKAVSGYVEEVETAAVPQDVASYVLERHGTLELEPMPTNDPKDPLNWPETKKTLHLVLVASQALLAPLFAAGMIPSYEPLAEKFERPLTDVSYFTSVEILVLGVGPLFWYPLMNKFGRRPILTLCAFCATAFNIGCGFSKTYGTQMALCVMVAFFMSPASALGNIVVTELFFSHQRGSKNGVWAMFLTLGPSFGPFLMSFVEQHAGTRWVFFVFAFMSFAVFLGWLVADETMYLRGDEQGRSVKRFFGIVTQTSYKFNFADVISPLLRYLDYRMFVVCTAYAVTFAYTNVVMSVEMPQVMGQKFHLDAQQTGLQFISIIIGTGLGEILSGPLSDYWMKWRINKRKGLKIIEDRMWVSYNGFILVIFGVIVWGVRMQQAQEGVWNVTPLIGAAFAAAGLQIVTTPLITYMVDVDPSKSVATGLFINLTRQIWGFTGPFYFPIMFEELGFGAACGVLAGLVGFVWLCTFVIHLVGIHRAHVSLF